ncbi:MAG: HAMP domain-containing protein [Alphaproteobacteria bacterium]|nr:HAMP domain-containing protein [Alphaproteobacteria bacterium]
MKQRLLWKLLAINLPIIGIVIAVLWLAIDVLAADYFTDLMERYKISPSETHQMFLDAIHRYFIQATIVAIAIAALLSVILTRKVLRPLSEIGEVTRRLAAGDYSARTTTESADEVGDLASAFNQMADSLEHLEGLRRTMVADFAHELRTPLTNIRGYLEALADGVVTPSNETYDILQDEIMRLVRLVEDLNQLTSADAARAYLRREKVDLRDFVERALALNRHEFDARSINVSVTFEPDAEQVEGDPDKLLQVIRNLIQNAWQYTPERGAFRIAASRTQAAVRIDFINTGAGITAADAQLVFERFHRIEKSRSRETGGAGIGLSIVKQLVEAHGGSVGVAPEGDEVRFWITLPA